MYKVTVSCKLRKQISFTISGLSSFNVTRVSNGSDECLFSPSDSSEILAVVKFDFAKKQASTPLGWYPLAPRVNWIAPYGLLHDINPSLHLPLTWWTPLWWRVVSLQRKRKCVRINYTTWHSLSSTYKHEGIFMTKLLSQLANIFLRGHKILPTLWVFFSWKDKALETKAWFQVYLIQLQITIKESYPFLNMITMSKNLILF